MSGHQPRHARRPRKRCQVSDADAVIILISLVGLVLTAIMTLAALGIVGPSAEQAVAPGPAVVCYAVRAPAYCPDIEVQAPSP